MSILLPSRRRRSRRPAWLAVAVAVAVLAVGAGAAAVAALRAPARPPSRSAPGPSPLLPRPPASSDARVPSRAAGPAVVSTAGWHADTADGAPVPASPGDGPARQHDGLASGFADSPAGAVIAAVNIAVRTGGQAGPAVFGPTIDDQVTGAGQQALLNSAWAEYDQATAQQKPATPGGADGTATAAVTAFDLTAWSAAQASVSLVASADGGQAQISIPVRLVWASGDWRLVAPSGGTFPAVTATAAVPSGYTPLPGR